MINEGLKQMETKTDFHTLCNVRVNTRHRSRYVSNLPLISLLYFLETRCIQQGQRCILSVLEIPKGVCFLITPAWQNQS